MRIVFFKKVILFGIMLLTFFTQGQARQFSNSDKIPIAVMDFKNNSSVIKFDRLERAVAEMLKTELSFYSDILVVERSKIENVLAEQALSQAGIIKSETAQEVGRLTGAQYIITGEINKTNRQLRIDAHLIKVNTGQIIGEKISSINEDNFEPMIKLLAGNLFYTLTGKGKHKQETKIHNYYSKWALLATSSVVVSTGILHFQYKNNYDKYHDITEIGEFNSFYDKANRNYKARNAMLIISGAMAVTSFILLGKDLSKSNKVYASNNKNSFGKKLTMGVAVKDNNCLLSLNLRF